MTAAWIAALLLLQQPLPQILNAPAEAASLGFYDGLEGPLYEEARRAYTEGDFAEAARRFELLHAREDHPAALFLAGNAHYRLNDAATAIDRYTRALGEGLDGMPDLHYNLANAYYATYRREEAIGEFRKVLDLTGGRDAMAHYHLGIVLDGEGRHEESIRHYRRTIELTGDGEPLARQHLGVAYFMNGQYAESVTELEAYLRQVPDDAGGYLNLGIALRYAGRLEEATVQLERSIAMSPEPLPAANYQLAHVHAAAGNHSEALAEMERAIAGGHDTPRVRSEYEEFKRRAGP